MNLREGGVEQLANVIVGTRNSAANYAQTDTEKWLISQQIYLFESFKENKADIKNENVPNAFDRTVADITVSDGFLSSIKASPDLRFIFYTVATGDEGKDTEMPGTGSSESIGMVYDRIEKKNYSLDLNGLTGITDFPWFVKDSAGIRSVDIGEIQWSPDGNQNFIQFRSYDNKDRWIASVDLFTGKLTVLNRQTDTAWIAGPGISGWDASGDAGWLADSKTIWFQSEASGYSHIYTYNTQSKHLKQITSGNFEVSDVVLSPNGEYWYYLATPEHPGIQNVYRTPVAGGNPEKMTSLNGGSSFYLSPDQKWIALLHSKANQPWEIYLQANKAGSVARRLTHSTTKVFDSYQWMVPDFVTVPASDGLPIYSRLYKPAEGKSNGAAVIFVHGAGYLQNAHQWWSNYYREYMFHNLLVSMGYTVLDMDYRGSAGYGRDWRTGIYRHMGGKDLSDHVDGAKWLAANHQIDAHRIGMYGGSYGGFITLMAMFTQPDVFACGAALRSVTDWAHYNHGYTVNILNTPVNDSIAYVRSSPIYFAEGLKGNLLMLHGMVDDNVQFQDIVRLNQRLIELRKENWELAVYPIEPHGFKTPTGWADEYKRIFNLFEENLLTK